MLEQRNAISVVEAIEKVMTFNKQGLKECIALPDAYGRYLAEDIFADHHVPPFDRSLYDGFAIRAEDTYERDYARFEVIGEIGAGSVFLGKVGALQAVRIMTGAQIPEGCNAVIMLEQTVSCKEEDKTYIQIKKSMNVGENIFFQGTDTKKGTLLLKKGTIINPGVIALLATFGYSQIHVSKKPVVGVLATGSELLELNEAIVPGKIRNSNSYMLMAQIEKAGGEAVYFGKLEDDLGKGITAVKEALHSVDILLTTGGVSVGDYDYLPDIYKHLGATVLFNKIAMRPGSVTTVAYLGKKLLFGLSGNPSASYVGFELFVRPLLRTLLGNEKPHLRCIQAQLGEDFLVPNTFTRMIRGKIMYGLHGLTVHSSGLDMSSAVSSLATADVLIILPSNDKGYKKGSIVHILLLADEEGSKQALLIDEYSI